MEINNFSVDLLCVFADLRHISDTLWIETAKLD